MPCKLMRKKILAESAYSRLGARREYSRAGGGLVVEGHVIPHTCWQASMAGRQPPRRYRRQDLPTPPAVRHPPPRGTGRIRPASPVRVRTGLMSTDPVRVHPREVPVAGEPMDVKVPPAGPGQVAVARPEQRVAVQVGGSG